MCENDDNDDDNEGDGNDDVVLTEAMPTYQVALMSVVGVAFIGFVVVFFVCR